MAKTKEKAPKGSKSRSLKESEVWTLINACQNSVNKIDEDLKKIEESLEDLSAEAKDRIQNLLRSSRANYFDMARLLEKAEKVTVTWDKS